MRDRIDHLTYSISEWAGAPMALLCALAIVAGWAIAGPFFGFSTAWQIFINTGTTIITFILVFVIQGSQNRDTKAMHRKLDTIIKHLADIPDDLIAAEDRPQRELEEIKQAQRP